MRKIGPLFAFLLAAAPTVALAQDPSFDRINLKLDQNGQTVDVTVTKSGKAVFVFPDHVLRKTLSADELAQLEASVKRTFTSQSASPSTDLGSRDGQPTFELTMNAANGTRWVAKGPVDYNRGGPLPPFYHVVKDLQGFEASAETAASLPAPADVKALPAPAEVKLLPAPPEVKLLPAPPELKLLPAPPELKLLPAPAAKAPRDIVFVEDGKKVEVLPDSGELVVTTSDGTQYRVPDPAAVAAVVKAATDAKLADHQANFKVNAKDASGERFQLYVQGADGARPLKLEGPVDVSSWNSDALRASVGPIVQALDAVMKKAETDHLAARTAADEKVAKDGKPGLFGFNNFVETFKAEANKFKTWGAETYRYLHNDFSAKDLLAKSRALGGDLLAKGKVLLPSLSMSGLFAKGKNLLAGAPDLFSKARTFLAPVGQFFSNLWDRFAHRGDAAKADAKDAADVKVDPATTDARGFSRTPGMADALDLRVQGEVDKADGKGSDKAP